MEKNYKHILIGNENKIKIFIEYGEYLKILKFAKAGASDGARGVLLGEYINNDIYIYKAIEAIYSGGEGIESPTFSPDSWGRISAEIIEKYNHFAILGQFSSHTPVKPLRTDYIMQDKFFDKSSHLLFVFDPTDNQEKMYLYNGRDFEDLTGFYLFDKYETPIDLSLRESILRPLCREYEIRVRIFDDIKKRIKRQNNIYAVFLIIIVLLIIFNTLKFFELEKHIDNLNFSDREKFEWKSES